MSSAKYLICRRNYWNSSSTTKVQTTIENPWVFLFLFLVFTFYEPINLLTFKLLNCWIICYATMETSHSDI